MHTLKGHMLVKGSIILLYATFCILHSPLSGYANKIPNDLKVSLKGMYGGIGISALAGVADSKVTSYNGDGYLWDDDLKQLDNAADGKLTETNPAGSAFVGFNYLWNNILVGIEGDITLTHFNSSSGVNDEKYITTPQIHYSLSKSVRAVWFASVTPRVGYRHRNALFFIAGGPAFSQFKYRFSYIDNESISNRSTYGSKNTYKIGWTIGAGYEQVLTTNWAVRLDYRYYNFNNIFTDYTTSLAPLNPNDGFSHSLDFTANMFRLSIIRHF